MVTHARASSGSRLVQTRRSSTFLLTAVAATLALLLPTVLPSGPAGAAPKQTVVQGTGVPAQDIANLQNAIARAPVDGVIQLRGHFDLGRGRSCVACIRIEKPLTIEGRQNPNVGRPMEKNLTIIENGVAPFLVDQSFDNRGEVIRFQNLWFRGQRLLAIGGVQSLDRIEFRSLRITNISPVFLFQQFRFAFGLATPSAQYARLRALDPDLTLAALEKEFPGIEVQFGGGVLQGEYVAADNHVDFLESPGRVPFLFGDDNGIALATCNFDSILVERNYVATRGESLEIEGCSGPGSTAIVRDNTLITDGVRSLEGFAIPPGGHPATMKLISNDADLTVTGNEVRVSGAPESVAVLNGSTNPDSISLFENNLFESDGQRINFLGGYVGVPLFWKPSSMHDTVVRGNTFVGNARTTMAFIDQSFVIPVPETPNINDANNNQFLDNDFSAFTAGRTALRFGPSTFDNLFVGDPNGPIIDEGTGNVFLP